MSIFLWMDFYKFGVFQHNPVYSVGKNKQTVMVLFIFLNTVLVENI